MFSTTLNAPRRTVAEYDNVLTWIVTALLAIGLVMVYSASIATAEAGKYTNYQPTYYLVRHGIFILTGVVAGIIAFQIPTQMWQKYAPYLFLIGVLLLLLVLIPGVGKSVNGSRRWLPLVIVNLQPSELMKLFAVLYAADYAVRKGAVKDHLLQPFLPMFGVMALVGALLLLEPDMGAFVVICAIAMGTLWLGGFNLKIFGGLVVLLPLAFAALILSSPYRMQRVIGFMDPWSDPYRQGLPAQPCADRVRPRRMAGRRTGRQRGETVLPAGSAYRLPARGDRGRAGPVRRVRRHPAVRRAHRARLRHRPSGGDVGAPVPRTGGAGHRRVAGRAGDDQHRREHGRAADQGLDAAVPEFRRQRRGGELHRHRGAAADRLRESTSCARAAGMSARTILIMAGGTGGHIYPGLAVADALRAQGWNVVWLGAPNSMEAELVPKHGYPVAWVNFSGVRGKGVLRLLTLPFTLLRALGQSAVAIFRHRPDVVLGMGGYITMPGGLMAAILRRPLVIHEQNSIAGMSNKVLAKISDARAERLPGCAETHGVVRQSGARRYRGIARAADALCRPRAAA